MAHPTEKIFDGDGTKLKSLRTSFEISQQTLALMLNVPSAQLDAWENGAPVPASAAEQIESARLSIAYSSFAAWKHRVSCTSGMEILLDRSLRIAAISRSALNTPFAEELGIDVPASVILGSHIHSALPTIDCKLIANHGTGLNDLYDIGFFEGAVRYVRISAEINFGRYAYCGDFEYWPVETCDAGIVVHQVSLLDLSKRPTLKTIGIHVLGTKIALRNG